VFARRLDNGIETARPTSVGEESLPSELSAARDLELSHTEVVRARGARPRGRKQPAPRAELLIDLVLEQRGEHVVWAHAPGGRCAEVAVVVA
jgi:hypothetical protein